MPSIKKQAWLGPEDFPQVPSLTTVTFTRGLPQVHATGEEVPTPPSLPFSPVISDTMQGGWVETRNTTNTGRFSKRAAAIRTANSFATSGRRCSALQLS